MIPKFIPKNVLETSADQTRFAAYDNGIEDCYPLNVDDIAEFHLGYDLLYGADLPTRVDGASDPITKLISVSKHVSHNGRQRFTVAHEIGHIVLHLPILIAQAEFQTALFALPQVPVQDDRLEFQANYFAAALLLPRVVMCSIFGERIANSEHVQADEVAYYFGVSLQAATLRMLELGFIRDTSPGNPLIF